MLDHTASACATCAATRLLSSRAGAARLWVGFEAEHDSFAARLRRARKSDTWFAERPNILPPEHLAWRAGRAARSMPSTRRPWRRRARQRPAGPAAALSRRTTTAHSCSIRTETMSRPSVTTPSSVGGSLPQRRRDLLRAIAGAATVSIAPSLLAQNSPSKPLRMILTAPPGSSIDVLGRLVAEPLRERLGQPVVAENRPQAGGTVGTDAVAKAPPTATRSACRSPGRWPPRSSSTPSCRTTRRATWRRSCSSAPHRTSSRSTAACR